MTNQTDIQKLDELNDRFARLQSRYIRTRDLDEMGKIFDQMVQVCDLQTTITNRIRGSN